MKNIKLLKLQRQTGNKKRFTDNSERDLKNCKKKKLFKEDRETDENRGKFNYWNL